MKISLFPVQKSPELVQFIARVHYRAGLARVWRGLTIKLLYILSAGSVYNTQHAHVPADTSDMNAIVMIVEYVTSYIICFII